MTDKPCPSLDRAKRSPANVTVESPILARPMASAQRHSPSSDNQRDMGFHNDGRSKANVDIVE